MPTADGEPRDDVPAGPPRRRWGRALLWLAAVVVLVVGAILISFAFEAAEDEDDAMAEPPFDSEVFCGLAGELSGLAELDLDSPQGASELRRLEVLARQLGTLTPGPITDDLDAVAEALADVSEVVESTPIDDPEAIDKVTRALDEELAAAEEEAERATAYIERWCGPLPEPPVTEPPVTEPPVTEPPVTEPPG